jgi:uncharacterized membrane protein YidH (DUF202 family)
MTDDPEDRDPGMARERTSFAWIRTALSFAAVGGAVLKNDVVPGLIVLCVVPVVWQLGRISHHRPGRLKLITVMIVGLAAVSLAAALLHL